jgi:hypothetical protein
MFDFQATSLSSHRQPIHKNPRISVRQVGYNQIRANRSVFEKTLWIGWRCQEALAWVRSHRADASLLMQFIRWVDGYFGFRRSFLKHHFLF